MQEDRPMLGILLMVGFCLTAPMGDAVAKLLGALVPIGMILIVRFGVQVILLAPLIRSWRLLFQRSRAHMGLIALRSIMHLVGIGMMITALQFLPLADAVAIVFVMPFLLLIFGRYLLGEQVGHRRVIACAVGFLGTIMVIQPSFAQVGWPALLPLGVALNFALFMLITRKMAKGINAIELQTMSGIVALVIMTPVVLLGSAFGLPLLTLVMPDLSAWGLLLGIGVLGTLAHLLMTWSLRYAPSATVAPIQFLEIPVAAVISWAVFDEWPGGDRPYRYRYRVALRSVHGLAQARDQAPGIAPQAPRPATACGNACAGRMINRPGPSVIIRTGPVARFEVPI